MSTYTVELKRDVGLSLASESGSESRFDVRGVKEAWRILQDLDKQLQSIGDIPDKLLQELSAGKVNRFSVVGPGGKKIMEVQDRVVQPKTADLKKVGEQWSVVEKYQNIVDDLSSAGLSWTTRFSGVKGGPTLLQQMKKLRIQAQGQLAKARSVLDALAQKHFPNNIRHAVDILSRALTKELEFKKIQRTFMVVPTKDKKRLQFFCYLGLVDLETKDGAIYPQYQVVVSSTPMINGGYDLFATTLRKFVLPTNFSRGKHFEVDKIDSSVVPQLMRFIRQAIQLDGVFSSFRATLPGNFKLDQIHPAVYKTKVRDDYIYVILKRGTKDLAKVNSEIMDQIQSALGMSNRRELISTKGRLPANGRTFLRYSVQSLSSDEKDWRMTNNKLRELQHILDLTDSDLVAIRHALKHG